MYLNLVIIKAKPELVKFRLFLWQKGNIMNKYLSVKEFAKQAGVSTQAIYQRMQGDLAPFLQIDNGKKRLEVGALELFQNKTLKQVGCATTNKALQDEITLELIKTLQAQLAEKDKQLASAAAEKEALLERLKDAQQSEQQAHALHAGTMQQTALLETRGEHPKTTFKQRFSWFKKQNGGAENA